VTDILLINPRLHGNDKYPPLSLIWLGAYLRREGYSVALCDAAALEYSLDDIRKQALKLNPKVIGITFMTAQFDYVRDTAQTLKQALPESTIIAGGIHVSVEPEDTLRSIPEIDYLVIGEGEVTTAELLAALRSGDVRPEEIAGLGFMKDGRFHRTPPRDLIEDLDSLPLPAWDLLPIDRYTVSQPDSRYTYDKGVALTISSSRGCPFRCKFCASGGVFGKGYRCRSPKKTADEIEMLVKDYGVTRFFIVDEVLTIKEKLIIELCNLILERGLEIRWAGNSRCDAGALKSNVMELMKKAGCRRVDFGVESGSPSVLKDINKGISLDKIRRAHTVVHKVGLATTTLMMCGHPTESPKDIGHSLLLLAYLDSEYPEFGPATPFPGTELYNEARRKNWLTDDKWGAYYISNFNRVMRNEYFTHDEIAMLSVYTNLVSNVFAELLEIKRYRKPKGTFRLAYNLLRVLNDTYHFGRFIYLSGPVRAKLVKAWICRDTKPEMMRDFLYGDFNKHTTICVGTTPKKADSILKDIEWKRALVIGDEPQAIHHLKKLLAAGFGDEKLAAPPGELLTAPDAAGEDAGTTGVNTGKLWRWARSAAGKGDVVLHLHMRKGIFANRNELLSGLWTPLRKGIPVYMVNSAHIGREISFNNLFTHITEIVKRLVSSLASRLVSPFMALRLSCLGRRNRAFSEDTASLSEELPEPLKAISREADTGPDRSGRQASGEQVETAAR